MRLLVKTSKLHLYGMCQAILRGRDFLLTHLFLIYIFNIEKKSPHFKIICQIYNINLKIISFSFKVFYLKLNILYVKEESLGNFDLKNFFLNHFILDIFVKALLMENLTPLIKLDKNDFKKLNCF
jgi:hypothetical protein